MGTQRDHAVDTSAGRASSTERAKSVERTTSWRDTVAAEYQMQQASLRFMIDDFGDVEEFL